MYDLKQLHKDFPFPEESDERKLLDIIYVQIRRGHFQDEIPITLSQDSHYSLFLKKMIVSCLGYRIVNPKPTFAFLIQKVNVT